ncbi:hypothetical protein SERLADRAFT_418842 [Serpula lacrymans var. lacrymans S7.9]|uniref:ubiquitinyl hydrolase 1 n=1 Tax=Serpula lacrymans var. lacrymans (strain S7.9) TaxID=578457 RepID=F8PE60_SERL9|nr:uncharacterized protein SERLADRAFT_418842 [Serpula lacrymans var. lacrymans S7.9]EGO18657.1 hypothetical protein SERLADRAFT_418842 [Serpula lacrymans var. lacrymans S7.9]
MAPKRRRRPSPSSKGLAAGERLKRSKLVGNESSAWGWVGTEVSDPSHITMEHRLMTCGLSRRNKNPCCPNKFAPDQRDRSKGPKHPKHEEQVHGEPEDVIVVSDEEVAECSSRACKSNPNCLNYLGQEKWEDEEKARRSFLLLSDLGENPAYDARDSNLPNLGATCYANAFLQVWFRDLAFRSGVYQCQPSQDTEHEYEDSPIFQLQVTFTALQESKQRVFNPSKLVESLRLSTSEQQDAQEFSKLFMSHLDFEFQKQLTPSLRSLVSDQNNSKLEGCIAGLLQPEKLTGDNKFEFLSRYLCSNCTSLQDAARYTELRRLPPVLHFSLLRFVYDISYMERKKSKHSPAAKRKASESTSDDSQDIYDLRGVLLHKGASAYHGHYEAQVFDVTTQTWYQFDDETVTKLESLGDRGLIVNGQGRMSRLYLRDCVYSNKSFSEDLSKARMSKTNAKKRKVVDGTDDEFNEVPTAVNGARPKDVKNCDIFSSKDAYMLIYARRGVVASGHVSDMDAPSSTTESDQDSFNLTPPSRALDVVNTLNAEHDEACKVFATKEDNLKLDFAKNSIVVCRQVLETWLTKPITKQKEASPQSLLDNDGVILVDTPIDILCKHDALDPQKSHRMKRMNVAAFQQIEATAEPTRLSARHPKDICEICVREIFIEKLYQIEHPQAVAQFDEVCDNELDQISYWISKNWLKDWRLSKPKMHTSLRGDVAPNAPEFIAHVTCEHGGLSLNVTARRRISAQASAIITSNKNACEILQNLFPQWQPVATTEQLCSVCESSIQMSKEDKREIRKRVENEKARLRHMHDNALTGNTLLLENVPCAIVPAQFIRLWRQWLNKPTDVVRPKTVDNSQFLCVHSKLVFDPNCPSDLDNCIAVVQRSEWNILEELYTCGPTIILEKRIVEGPHNNAEVRFFHDVPVCDECRLKRQLDYEATELTVRVLGPGDSASKIGKQVDQLDSEEQMASKGPRKLSGVRQSKRIRQTKDRGETRRLTIYKSTTVKEIKIMLYEQLKIPTIYQRLFYRGQELQDNLATVQSLGILINDILDLQEELEDDNNLNVSNGEAKRGFAEEKGFGGTLLSGLPTDRSSSSEREQTPLVTDVKSCPSCTFCNDPDAVVCEICAEAFT